MKCYMHVAKVKGYNMHAHAGDIRNKYIINEWKYQLIASHQRSFLCMEPSEQSMTWQLHGSPKINPEEVVIKKNTFEVYKRSSHN